jgi:hypothetical protein
MYSYFSPNYFNFGYAYDWCVSEGVVRVSEKDHSSSFKDPRTLERGKNLAEFIFDKYPFI